MNQFFLIAITAGIIAFVATPLTLVLARRWRFVATPRATRWHLAPVPLMGGLAIWLGLALSLLVFGLADELRELVAVLLGVTLVAGIGLVDDRNGISPRGKMLGQLAAAGVVIAGGVHTQLFDYAVLDIVLTLFWVVGITNAINFMDNMDGLAAGVSAAAAGSFLLLALLNEQILVASLAAALLGACTGFLVYNFQPALTFMGDVGSLTLGFTLAVLGIKLTFPGLPTQLTWMIPVLVLAVPIFDTVLVVISRWRRGVPASRGGVDHTSHRLARLGLSSRRVVVALYSLTMAFGLVAILVTFTNILIANLITIGLSILGMVALYVMERVGALPLTEAIKPGVHVVVIGGGKAVLPILSAAMQLTQHVTLVLASASSAARGSTAVVGEISADVLRSVWPVLAHHSAAVESIVKQTPQLFDQGSLTERVEFAMLGLHLRGRVVVCDSSQPDELKTAGAVVNGVTLEVLGEADLVLIGGDLEENTLAVLQVTDIAQALRRVRCPKVLIHDDPAAALATLKVAGVAEVVTHAIAPQTATGPWITVPDLNRSESLANALAGVWVERTQLRGPLPALAGLLNG